VHGRYILVWPKKALVQAEPARKAKVLLLTQKRTRTAVFQMRANRNRTSNKANYDEQKNLTGSSLLGEGFQGSEQYAARHG
jgi:hypothetical protein